MNPRASFSEEDAWVSIQETTVQIRSARSTVRDLEVRLVPASAITELIIKEHYLHSMPIAPCACFGVFIADELHGGVVITAGARHAHRVILAARPQEVMTLARLWLSGRCPTNSESRALGFVLRYLKRHTDWKLILSYADPTAGHVGVIYQATGWLYLGLGAPSSYLDLGDGRLLHPRSVYERVGSNAIRHLRNTGIPATRRAMPGKHRYAYLLAPSWRWRLTGLPQPFPPRLEYPQRRRL